MLIFKYSTPFVSPTAYCEVHECESTHDGQTYQYESNLYDKNALGVYEMTESSPIMTLEEVLSEIKYDIAWTVQHDINSVTQKSTYDFVQAAVARTL